jgi:hypothetical protein
MMTSTPEEKAEILDVADKSDRRKFRLDWRLPIPGLITASIVVIGWVWLAAEKSDALSEVQRVTEVHTSQLSHLDAVTIQTNLDLADLRGDIKQILAILHRQDEHRP